MFSSYNNDAFEATINNDFGEALEPNLNNSFVVRINLDPPFHCNPDFFSTPNVVVKIISDFEHRSVHSVCFFLMSADKYTYMYPLSNQYIAIFSDRVPDLKAAEKQCNLELQTITENEKQEFSMGSYNHLRGLLTYLLYTHLVMKGWFSFAYTDESNDNDDLMNLVLAKFDANREFFTSDSSNSSTNNDSNPQGPHLQYVDVVALKTVTVEYNQDANFDSCLCTHANVLFETSCCKAVGLGPLDTASEYQSSATAFATPAFTVATWLLTGEHVKIHRPQPHVLSTGQSPSTSATASAAKSVSTKVLAKSTTKSNNPYIDENHTNNVPTIPTRPSTSSSFLTSNDDINRNRGYSTYLPSNEVEFRAYWHLSYGWDIDSHEDPRLGMSSSALQGERVQRQPLHVIEVHTRSGPRILPRSLLYRSVVELPSRTRRRACTVADDIAYTLQSASFIRDVCRPHRTGDAAISVEDTCNSKPLISESQMTHPLAGRLRTALSMKKRSETWTRNATSLVTDLSVEATISKTSTTALTSNVKRVDSLAPQVNNSKSLGGIGGTVTAVGSGGVSRKYALPITSKAIQIQAHRGKGAQLPSVPQKSVSKTVESDDSLSLTSSDDEEEEEEDNNLEPKVTHNLAATAHKPITYPCKQQSKVTPSSSVLIQTVKEAVPVRTVPTAKLSSNSNTTSPSPSPKPVARVDVQGDSSPDSLDSASFLFEDSPGDAVVTSPAAASHVAASTSTSSSSSSAAAVAVAAKGSIKSSQEPKASQPSTIHTSASKKAHKTISKTTVPSKSVPHSDSSLSSVDPLSVDANVVCKSKDRIRAQESGPGNLSKKPKK